MRAENDERLTAVGPGTAMGEMMRHYWIPALLSSEVERDAPPVRVKLLGEELVAFRTASGAVGLMDHRCPHRCASLVFGRNEDEGLRCVYHGWKFAPDGKCVDMPSEPPDSDFKDKVRAQAYPTRERAGLVWAFLGSEREQLPELPEIEATLLPEGDGNVWAAMRECNWLQALEGDIDTSHFGFLHAGSATEEQLAPGSPSLYAVRDRAPRYRVAETACGTMYGAYRPGEGDNVYWRIAHFLFPFWTMPPGSPMPKQMVARAWVPMDDEHTMFFHVSRRGSGPSRNRMAGRSVVGLGTEVELRPNENDWYGRWRLECNMANDYHIDRELQRAGQGDGSYTGISAGHVQDQMVTESMGPIVDRTREHLASSDQMIIQTRRRLLRALDALAAGGESPPGADDPAVYDLIRSGTLMLEPDANWLEEVEKVKARIAKAR